MELFSAHPCMRLRTRLPVGLAFALTLSAGPALAQQTLDAVVVKAAREKPLDEPQPVGASVGRKVLDHSMTVTTEHAMRYLPNIQLRQRYIGDIGGTVAVRGTSGFQSARILVTVDGMPISNLLGSGYGYAPLWGLVFPDEIDRVDVMYGPYSARFSGNTLGAGIFIRTRMPDKLEGGVDVSYGNQHFDTLQTHDSLNTRHAQAWIGDRIGRVAWSLGVDHLDSDGQPAYIAFLPATAVRSMAGTPVSGALDGVDASGKRRYLVGTSGPSSALSNLIKGKARVDLSDSTSLTLQAAYRDLHFQSLAPESYLRTRGGVPLLTGPVNIDGSAYNLSNTLGFRQQDVRLRDAIAGAMLSSQLADDLQGQFSASGYRVIHGETRQAYPGGNGAQVTPTDRQGWFNAAARFALTPDGLPWLGKELGFGVDYARYWMRTSTYGSPDWRGGARGALAERSAGKTDQLGMYVDDRWSLGSQWTVMAGLRHDRWRAFEGARQTAVASIDYPRRHTNGWSPNLGVRFEPGDDWSIELRGAQAWRFPTVTELFQSSLTGGVLVQSDPNLRPEHATTFNLGASKVFGVAGGTLRLTADVFQERVRNTLFSQATAFAESSYYQNIGLVRTRGVDLLGTARDLFDGLLDVDASVARQKGIIRQNDILPATVGNEMPRVPHWRWSVLATIHPTARLDASLGVRHEGLQYNDIGNTDGRRGGVGYVDAYTFVETQVAYRLTPSVQLSLGIDNLFDSIRYAYHPYPGRTTLFSVKWRPE
ncbi:MAG: Vitamin B12 transporter BtuB [Luteibacter sp.]|uniref:TonB-dependent receptor n=1 Tax=Luteibacter sp. TaxID=1886636 RepID=UPI0013857366|nr:TonB-dependent receptor [Luteibacter sp.]KAF1008227.1 MAG: Vitamin B12 transporter BtuB [Luteibacter sp.]